MSNDFIIMLYVFKNINRTKNNLLTTLFPAIISIFFQTMNLMTLNDQNSK